MKLHISVRRVTSVLMAGLLSLLAVMIGIRETNGQAEYLTTKADRISDSNTTTDGTSATVNAGKGEVLTCVFSTESTPNFSCSDPDGFTCYGFRNCSALGATGGVLNLADFLDEYGYGPVQVTQAGAPVLTRQ
jgi:hypothetical protein